MNDQQETRAPDDGLKGKVMATFVLFGYLFVSPSKIKEILARRDRIIVLIGVLEAIGMSLVTSLAVLGMLDGPGVVQQLLVGNYTIHSQTLLTWAIYSFLFILMIILGAGFVAPFLLNLLFNYTRKRESRIAPPPGSAPPRRRRARWPAPRRRSNGGWEGRAGSFDALSRRFVEGEERELLDVAGDQIRRTDAEQTHRLRRGLGGANQLSGAG